ncbi:hypothetical protein ACOMHN_060661 [Nucella lapillus]
MGGSNCALSNCPAYKSKHRGLSFHKIPRKGENDAHRQLLIQTIDREDEWFMKEKKKDNANIFICSRHYSGECYKHTPGNQKPTLIPGSVPTLIMPVKSVETKSQMNENHQCKEILRQCPKESTTTPLMT